MTEEDLISDTPPADPKAKAPKAKKRPSDFEIFRTILTRTHERKLPFLVKDMGEDPDILFLCSAGEDGFTYGSPDLALTIIEISDPELKTVFETYLGKLHGYHNDKHQPRFINVRDQISELAKTKGETLDTDVKSNAHGSIWTTKVDKAEKEKVIYFTKAVDSLFHVQLVKSWCAQYRPLLNGEDPEHLYYPQTERLSETAGLITLPPPANDNHPLKYLYPHGLRFMATKGFDMLLDVFPIELPDPVLSQEFIAFRDGGSSVLHVCHRMVAQGWRMLALRPNMYIFPTLETHVPSIGPHSL
jgi:hypothetical protein